MLSRRQLLRAGAAALGAPIAAGLYTWLVEPHWLEITTPDLHVRGLPEELDGATLAQLTDLHIGPKVDDDYIRHVFRAVAGLRPDFVVLTGDCITYDGPERVEQMRRVFQDLPNGRIATVGVLGNHDYGYGWKMLPVAGQVARAAAEAGVTVLRNEAFTVRGLTFLGLDDLWTPAWGPQKLLAAQGGGGAAIALCHNPDAADRDVWGAFRGWILSGHTHGGQCKPPFLPPPLLPVRNRRYTSGPFDLTEGRRLYISRGVGHLLKVRFNVRPEVPLFTLRAVPGTDTA